jgi:hypothetical protein
MVARDCINGELEMLVNIPSNIEAQYATEDAALSAAFWATMKAAKITRAEWRAWGHVKDAECVISRLVASSAPGHRRKLLKLFGTADLVHLRKSHGDHPAVLAAIKAVHKRAGITRKDLEDYERMERIDHGNAPVPGPHKETLRSMFGKATFAAARRAFNAKWDRYYEGIYASAA